MLMSRVDHCGNLAYLNFNNGFNGRILGTNQTLEVAKELIEDTLNIHIKNKEKLKCLGKKTRPLYTKQDMFDMFEKMEVVPSYKKITLNEWVTIEFVNAGHCLGSSMIHLWIKKPNQSIFHIIMSGDMGSEQNKLIHPLAEKREQITKCNLFISEATYNKKSRSFNKCDVQKEFEDFKYTIKENLLQGKQILLPVFSFNKVQEFLILFYEWLKDEEWFNKNDFPIICDGVLMHKITNVFKRTLCDDKKDYFNEVCNWNKIKVNKTFDGTMAIMSKKEPMIIMASSGFMQQGRVVAYVKQLLGSKKGVILTTGYIGGEGSIGWKIAESPQKTVSIEKQVILKRALVKSYHCFSSHIQYDELESLYAGLQCEKILIHHSSKEDKLNFVNEMRKNTNKKIECVTDKNYEFIF